MRFTSSLLFVAATSLFGIGSLALPQAVDPTQDATSCSQFCGNAVPTDAATTQACLSQPSIPSLTLQCLCRATTFVTAVEGCMTARCPQFSGAFESSCRTILATGSVDPSPPDSSSTDTGSTDTGSTGTGSTDTVPSTTDSSSSSPPSDTTTTSTDSQGPQDAKSCAQSCAPTITPDAATEQCLVKATGPDDSTRCLCASASFTAAIETCVLQRCPQFAGEFKSTCAVVTDPGSSDDEDNGAGQSAGSALVSLGVAVFAVLFL